MRTFGFVFLLFCSLLSFAQGGGTIDFDLVINEVDVDNPGTDVQEFIELYGTPGAVLDGLVVVSYNGSSDQVYLQWDLDGYALDDEGFFVLGSAAVPNVGLVFDNNLLQNGPEAIAIYLGDAIDFPNGTDLTAVNLIDAMVYETNDNDDTGLLSLLEVGQAQVDESANGNSGGDSMSRIPDGGTPLLTETYAMQVPTPGFTNVLQCDGGTIQFEEGGTEEQACVDLNEAFLEFTAATTADQSEYIWIITTESNGIESFTFDPEFDFTGQPVGFCRVWGLSFSGELDLSSLQPGNPLSGVSADECAFPSANFLTVEKVTCIAPVCDGGTVTSDNGTSPVIVCLDGANTAVTLSFATEAPDASYVYIVTDENNEIIEFVNDIEYDFGGVEEATCFIYGFSYLGDLVESTFEEGDPVLLVQSTDCGSLSSNAIEIEKVLCDGSASCSDLFFSEYIEGNGSNKALELYNPTPFDVDLSNYTIQTYNDGSTVAQNSLQLSGTLASGATYVIVNSTSIAPLLALADITSNVTLYNGNDATVLRNNGVIIDAIGIIGNDPGKANPYPVSGGEGTLAEYTLVRQLTVTEGNENWSIVAEQWDVYSVDTFDFLGEHSVIPCDYNEEPSVGFAATTMNVNEGNFVNVVVNVAFPIIASEVQVNYIGGTATLLDDFEDVFPVVLSFPEGDFSSQSFFFLTIDDLDLEPGETIILELEALTDVTLLNTEMVINILPSDQDIPLYSIEEVSGNSETLEADSLNVLCELRGIVHGLNTTPEGLQFTLIDPTDGINIYNAISSFGYTVVEGDSIHVTGIIDQFNGLTQLVADTIYLISQDNELNEPELVGDLDETTESQMIQLKCIEIVDLADWTNEEPGFTLTVTDGTNEYDLRIDADADIFGTDAPEGVFSVSGIGGQFDSSSPYDEGYQIQPRYLADMTDFVTADFEEPTAIIVGEDVTFTNLSEGAISYLWNFGNGSTSSEFEPTTVFNSVESYTVTLTAFNATCSDQFTFDVDVNVGVNELEAIELKLYPIPANEVLNIQSNSLISSIEVHDLAGRIVLSQGIVNGNKLALNIRSLAAGSYVLKVAFENGTKGMRFIKH
jgi:hypothetical protein